MDDTTKCLSLYILKNKSLNEVSCVSWAQAKQFAEDNGKSDLYDLFSYATPDDVSNFGVSDDAELSLMELTEFEAGLIVFPNGEIITCNWASVPENTIPRVLFGNLINIETDIHLAKYVFTDVWYDHEEFLGLLPNTEDSFIESLVYTDFNDDEIEKETHVLYSDDKGARVWELDDGTMIIHPDEWC